MGTVWTIGVGGESWTRVPILSGRHWVLGVRETRGVCGWGGSSRREPRHLNLARCSERGSVPRRNSRPSPWGDLRGGPGVFPRPPVLRVVTTPGSLGPRPDREVWAGARPPHSDETKEAHPWLSRQSPDVPSGVGDGGRGGRDPWAHSDGSSLLPQSLWRR